MTSSADLRVIFCAPAGARRGFGHLVRCISLARALGVRPLVLLRGNRHAREVALALGADVLVSHEPRRVRATRFDVVVVDDPIESAARRSIAAARRAGALVVTVHDLGIGCPDGDVVIDGSVTDTARARKGKLSLAGTRFAILGAQYSHTPVGRALSGSPGKPDKACPTSANIGTENIGTKNVLIALGGGPHAKTAAAIATAIVAADPDAQVRIAGGFVARPRTVAPRVTWVAARRGLAPELSAADVAIVGGGVSLYEACAMGVPTVALPVVSAQARTVRAFAKQGAAIGLDALDGCADIRTAAARAVALLNNPHQRAALARRSTRLVDGLGASRAAAAVSALSRQGH